MKYSCELIVQFKIRQKIIMFNTLCLTDILFVFCGKNYEDIGKNTNFNSVEGPDLKRNPLLNILHDHYTVIDTK